MGTCIPYCCRRCCTANANAGAEAEDIFYKKDSDALGRYQWYRLHRRVTSASAVPCAAAPPSDGDDDDRYPWYARPYTFI